MPPDDPAEVERDRQAAEAELEVDDPGWRDRFAPGTFGCHELLDRLSLIARLLDESAVSHPACVHNPELYALARRASDAVNGLYQQVGGEHL